MKNDLNEIFGAVRKELARAQGKFPKWPTDMIHAAGILTEESGEVMKEVLQFIYEPEKKSTIYEIKEELIQVMAMAARMFLNMKHYKPHLTFETSFCENSCEDCIEYLDGGDVHICRIESQEFPNVEKCVCFKKIFIENDEKGCSECNHNIPGDFHDKCSADSKYFPFAENCTCFKKKDDFYPVSCDVCCYVHNSACDYIPNGYSVDAKRLVAINCKDFDVVKKKEFDKIMLDKKENI